MPVPFFSYRTSVLSLFTLPRLNLHPWNSANTFKIWTESDI